MLDVLVAEPAAVPADGEADVRARVAGARVLGPEGSDGVSTLDADGHCVCKVCGRLRVYVRLCSSVLSCPVLSCPVLPFPSSPGSPPLRFSVSLPSRGILCKHVCAPVESQLERPLSIVCRK